MTKLKFPKNYKSLSIEEMTFLDGGYRATRQTWIPTQTRRISTSEYTLKADLGSALIGAGLSFVTGGTSILAVTASAIASSFFGHGGNAALAREADAKDGSIVAGLQEQLLDIIELKLILIHQIVIKEQCFKMKKTKLLYNLFIGAGVGLTITFMFKEFTLPIKVIGLIISITLLVGGLILNFKANHKKD